MKMRAISLLLALAVCFNLNVLAYAIEPEETEDDAPIVQTFSEYESLLEIVNGASIMPANASNVDYELAAEALEEYKYQIEERAKLPENILTAYGYTEEQITLLKKYLAGEKSFEEIAALTSAQLTTEIQCLQHTETLYSISYGWRWSSVPLTLSSDAVAFTYNGIRNSSDPIDVKLNSYSSNINYYDRITGAFYTAERGNFDVTNNYVTAEFQCEKMNSTGNDYVWAKTGVINVSISPTVPGAGNALSAVRVQGAYGHTVTPNSEVSVSVTISAGRLNCTIDFSVSTPSGIVETWGKKQFVYYNDGSCAVEFP